MLKDILNKTLLGQFNTTNKNYILSGLEQYIKFKNCIDPFAGNGDLLEWADFFGASSVQGYDVDENKVSLNISLRDTLLNPLDYNNNLVITNPPYLAQNKCKDKTIYNLYKQDDLYKIAILTIQSCDEGILIVPLNFLSSIGANSIRDIFFNNYEIIKCNVFEESVFDDTDYTVCSFYFNKKSKVSNKNEIDITFYPSGCNKKFIISKKNHWILGGEFYEEFHDISFKGVGRWTIDNGLVESDNKLSEFGNIYINDFLDKPKKKDEKVINGLQENTYFNKKILNDIILIKAIDTGTSIGRLGLDDIRKFTKNYDPVLLGLKTSRNLAHVKFDKYISIENQLKIIEIVNNKINELREKYHSVFLTSFRNSTSLYSRKRISFEIMYKMIIKTARNIGCEI